MPIKLYGVFDGPPSFAVRMVLKALDLPYEWINVDYSVGGLATEQFYKLNPQREAPVIDDDGFYLSETNAIIQYLCDRYGADSPLYPREPHTRALVNHRLCFNLSTYYQYISQYALAPIYYGYERTPLGLKKVEIALRCFDTYLERLGKKYVAADHVTVADFPLYVSTLSLDVIQYDVSKFKKIASWSNTFKNEYPELHEIAEEVVQQLKAFEANPPNLMHIDHPIHPKRIL